MERKEVTIEDLKVNEYFDKPIEANGSYVRSLTGESYSINYSSILTKLIQEAGRWCENYASDLFITWNEIIEKLKNKKIGTEKLTELFGFRASGVDHKEFVMSRLNKNNESEYRALWRIDITADPEAENSYQRAINMKLYRVR